MVNSSVVVYVPLLLIVILIGVKSCRPSWTREDKAAGDRGEVGAGAEAEGGAGAEVTAGAGAGVAEDGADVRRRAA